MINVRYILFGIDGTYNLTFTRHIQFYCSKQVITNIFLMTMTQHGSEYNCESAQAIFLRNRRAKLVQICLEEIFQNLFN